MAILNIVLYFIAVLAIFSFISLVILGIRILNLFNFRKCKCGHIMAYRGLKEDGSDGYYLFHCKHCGAWEKISKEDFCNEIKIY